MGDVAKLLESQFEEWNQSEENSQSFFMVSCERNDSGGARIEMMDLTDRTVSLSCSQYDPSSHRARFEVHNSKESWAESVKEHLGDQESRSLGQVMALVMEAMEATNKMDVQSEEEEDNEEVDMKEYDENEEYENAFSDFEDEVDDSCIYNQSDIEFLFKKNLWLKETAKLLENLRGELTKESAELLSRSINIKKGEDLYVSEDANKLMVNELERVLNRSEKSKVHIEPINNVLYQLNVRIMTEAFDEKSVLSQGLKKSGVYCVSFNLFFNPFLYPFSPPEVQMVSPRLVGFSGQPFVSLDVFKPLRSPYWSHTRFLYLFIEDIRGFLQTHAMVEVGYPLGHRYLILEDSIQQLGMLTRQGKSYEIQAIKAKAPGYGTGYSSGYGTTQAKETVKYHKFLEEKREERIVTLLTEIRNQIQLYSKLRDAQDASTFENVSCFGKNSWFWYKTWASDPESTDSNLELFKSLEPQNLCRIINYSCLMVYLENYFENNTLFGFNANFELFETSSQVILEMATHAYFLPMLVKSYKKSIFTTMNLLHGPALTVKATEERKNNEKIAQYIIKINDLLNQNEKSQIDLLECFQGTEASDPNATPQEISCKSLKNKMAEASDSNATPQDFYCKALKKLFLFDSTHLRSHSYMKDKAAKSDLRQMTLVNELSILSSSLPCDYSSSIFVRSDASDMSRLRILIIGPEGTPYSNGCYFFDMKFHENFPHRAPRVHFKMAGNHKYHMINPNLHNNGTVCLSLLNTGEEKKWSPKSTLIQVIVSLQSLLMAKEPYLTMTATERLEDEHKVGPSQAYTTNTRAYNIEYGIMDPLTNVYPEFEEIIKTHIFLKREQILKEVDAWVDEADDFVKEYSPVEIEDANLPTTDVFRQHSVHIRSLRDSLRTMLENLEKEF